MVLKLDNLASSEMYLLITVSISTIHARVDMIATTLHRYFAHSSCITHKNLTRYRSLPFCQERNDLEMITKFITDVSTKFNPFRKSAKTCRSFLAHLPSNARQVMKVNTQVLPRHSQDPSSLSLKFSTSCTSLHTVNLGTYRIYQLIE